MELNDNFYFILTLSLFILASIKYLGIFHFLDVLFLSRETKWELKNFFGKHFHYFNQLSGVDQERFIIRAYKLSKSLNIQGRQGFVITSKVRLFVVSAHVQLTFGFKHYTLNKFHTILIYPDAYQNKITGNMHYGEVNPKGVIVLSWKRLVKGFSIHDDKINLGLHEMAHALMHTIIHSSDHENGLNDYLRNIVRLSKDEMKKIKSDEYHFFRTYASTNIYEFFAVAVEHFFEVPQEFKNELPRLYEYMVKLLKQNPI